jgi:hypothetical protein
VRRDYHPLRGGDACRRRIDAVLRESADGPLAT